MNSQINLAKSIDSLLILGGEKEDHSRTTHACEIYFNLDREDILPFVLSGSHDGLTYGAKYSGKTDAQNMEEYLLHLGVLEEQIFKEEKSIDTLSNMIYSRPIIDQLLSDSQTKKIGLITDNFHMKRSLWTAQRVFPSNYEIVPLPTNINASLGDRIVESSVKLSWKFDLWREGIKAGEQDKFKEYIQRKHPLYVENSNFSLYKTGIFFMRLFKKKNSKHND